MTGCPDDRGLLPGSSEDAEGRGTEELKEKEDGCVPWNVYTARPCSVHPGMS